jgi:adenylate cyclase
MSRGDALHRWLVDGAPGASTSAEVLARFSAELVAAEVPIARVLVFVRTLHPDTMGRWFLWRRDHRETNVGDVPFGMQHDFFANGPLESVIATGVPFRRRLAGPGPFGAQILDRLKTEGVTDYVALPLCFLDGTRHVLSLATEAAGGFSDDDRALIDRVATPLARLAEILALRRTATNLLDAYVGHGAGARILSGRVQRGDVERIRCAIWFSDLRGFTTLSEERTPEEIILVLNRVFDCQVPAVQHHGGEVLKFMGDGMLAIFPVGEAGAAAVCQAALKAARAAHQGLDTLNEERAGLGAAPLAFGIGLHLGEVAYGNIGGAGRLDFTCIGPAVNLASRVESLTGTLGRPILLTADFAAASESPTEAVGSFELKGVSRPVVVHVPTAS